MKTCLIVALDFPPSPSIAAVRLYHMSQSLLAQGWKVKVLTVKPEWVEKPSLEYPMDELLGDPNFELLPSKMWFPSLYGYYSKRWYESRVLNAILKRTFRKLEIDVSFGWKGYAIRRGLKDLKAGDVDVILASAPPFVVFSIASKLAKKLKAPYVMDYRDTWSIYPHRAKASERTMNFERKLLKGASAVITISKSFGSAMTKVFDLAQKMNILENGYAPDASSIPAPTSKNGGVLKIVYAGTFYLPKRRIDPFLSALSKLKKVGNEVSSKIEFHYFGPSSSLVQEAVLKYDVQELLKDHSSQPRSVVHEALQTSDYALVITSVLPEGDDWDKGIMTGKVFENLKFRIPTMLIAPDDADLREVIDGLDAGKCFAGNEEEEMMKFLQGELQERSTYSFTNMEQYEWTNLGKRLSDLLHKQTVE